jgi:hypothetical protein
VEEYELEMFENKELRRIPGPEGTEIIRSLRKLHDDDLH